MATTPLDLMPLVKSQFANTDYETIPNSNNNHNRWGASATAAPSTTSGVGGATSYFSGGEGGAAAVVTRSPHTSPFASKFPRAAAAHRRNNSYTYSDLDEDNVDDLEDEDLHKTTLSQTFVHLVKGYIGCGILSLPWAVSQLGIPIGALSIIVLSFWTSYNAWNVVKMKRFMERHIIPYQTPNNNAPTATNSSSAGGAAAAASADDEQSEAPSEVTTATNITYPDVGEWAYGRQFNKYIRACVCTQQLAICTVFMSFVGENTLAILIRMGITEPHFLFGTHFGVLTMALPFVLLLSYIPTLKQLSPVMTAASVSLMIGFALLGCVMILKFPDRAEALATSNGTDGYDIWNTNWGQAPLGMCAILYSYEGICLILPVESAMKEPQRFKSAFAISMTVVAVLLVAVSCLSVWIFGHVSNGSITAFLLHQYADDPSMNALLMFTNAMVSLSVMLTYPLQLFPALELLAPWVMESSRQNKNNNLFELLKSHREGDNEEKDLEGFEPLPPLPEHDTASLGSIPDYHDYDQGTGVTWDANVKGGEGDANNGLDPAVVNGLLTSKSNNASTDEDDNNNPNETTATNDNDDAVSEFSQRAMSSVTSFLPDINASPLEGDSLQLRTMTVLITYMVAVAIPNVETLVSLAGAVAGSSTALLIPPVLELALIRHLESSGGFPADPPNTNANNNNNMDDAASVWWVVRAARHKWAMERLKCYVLFGLGLVFTLIGTYASLADIVRLWFE